MKSDKAKAPAPKRLQKPNIAVRVLALTVTAALVLGALVLVVYRDTLNVDTLKHWLASQDPDAGDAAPFTHAGVTSCPSPIWTAAWSPPPPPAPITTPWTAPP